MWLGDDSKVTQKTVRSDSEYGVNQFIGTSE